MGLLGKLFGGGKSDDPPEMPWDRKPSVFEYIASHLDGDGRLPAVGQQLPDEESFSSGARIRWAAGAMDGVLTHHSGGTDDSRAIKGVTKKVLAYSRQPTAHNKAAVYQAVMEEHIVSLIDPVIEALLEEQGIDHQRLYELAHSFAHDSPDREPVKFGLAILGLFPSADAEVFYALGAHDEFTLFCAVALANREEGRERALWKLAQRVEGWGRIHVVERLANAEEPDVKDWLLREGYRNSVMYEYLAFTAATAGDLKTALAASNVDRDLLTSAGEILHALVCGGPVESLDDYADAADVADAYLGHLRRAGPRPGDFITVQSLQSYVEDGEADWDVRGECGWTPERRANVAEQSRQYMALPQWPEIVEKAFQGEDEVEIFQASAIARSLGIDVWEHHWRRLQGQPANSSRWYPVTSTVDERRLPRLLGFAGQSLNLQRLASGPAMELGMGPEWEEHSALGYVLQELARFPGEGGEFIISGLKSPVVRNRNMALNALATWPRDNWVPSVQAALEEAARHEPDEKVTQRMQRLLDGEPIE